MSGIAQLLIQLSLCVLTFCQSTKINPANYIWINYDAKIQLTSLGNSLFTFPIPCVARFGKCSYSLTVLPPNWLLSKDGIITLPAQDSFTGSYAIKGQFSEITGERINANLVVQIQKRVATVLDEATYYAKLGYTPSEVPVYGASTYQQSLLVKSQPDGFPSITELESRISGAQASSIDSILNEIVEKYAPCRSRANYLKEVKSLLTKLMTKNSDKLNEYDKSKQALQIKLKDLQSQKSDYLQNKGINKQIADLQRNIDSINTEINQLLFNGNIYESQLRTTLQRIRDYGIDVSKLTNPELSDTESQITNATKTLESLNANSLDLFVSIYNSRFEKENQGVPLTLLQSQKVAAFSAALKTATAAKAEILKNDQKLIVLQAQKDLQQKYNSIIDKKLQEIDQAISKINTSDSNMKVLNDKNKSLNDSLTSLKKFQNNSSCAGKP